MSTTTSNDRAEDAAPERAGTANRPSAGATPHSTVEALARRVSYRLGYTMLPESRSFSLDAIKGPKIPNSYRPEELSDGTWCLGADVQDVSEDSLLRSWINGAICEVIHEALEWFRLDGELVLDPHGKDDAIVDSCSAVAGDAVLALIPEDRFDTTTAVVGNDPNGRPLAVDRDWWSEAESFARTVATRVDYRMGFLPAPEPRGFSATMLDAGDIPDSRHPGERIHGGWSDYTLDAQLAAAPDRDTLPGIALTGFLHMALAEAIHEVLEWFRVDGALALDPHQHMSALDSVTRTLAEELAALALPISPLS